ncbi:MAG: sensor domain-containing protein [Candidatus Kariarchaeaceae archaeon]|jgi:hypothetical protein
MTQGEIIYPEADSIKKELDRIGEPIFKVFFKKQTYKSLLYVLFIFIFGIIAFTYAVTGIALSIGLGITIIGLPLAYYFLRSLDYLMLFLGKVSRGLVGTDIPDKLKPLELEGSMYQRTWQLLRNRRILFSLAYMLFVMLFGIALFVSTIVGLSLGLGLFSALFYPIVRSILKSADVDFDEPEYFNDIWWQILSYVVIPILGLIILTITLTATNEACKKHGEMIEDILYK